MKKLLFAACLAAFCLTSCNNGKNNTQDLANQQNDSLNSIIAQKDSEINDMMGTLNEIQDGLNQISEAEHRVTLLKNGEGASKRQQLKEDVQFIATRMQQNRELLAKLQKQMANSSLQADQLKKTIANLQEQIAQKALLSVVVFVQKSVGSFRFLFVQIMVYFQTGPTKPKLCRSR